jgi:hypothetical protein
MRHKCETAARRYRRLAHGEKKARVANVMHITALTAGATTASPYIPGSTSPLTPGLFSDHRDATLRFSPHYADVAGMA